MLSLPPIWAERWLTRQPNSFNVGRITGAADTVLWSDDNTPVKNESFEHFPNNEPTPLNLKGRFESSG